VLTDNEHWPWALDVRILVEVPLLSRAPRLSDVGIEGRSLRRQSYIRMSEPAGASRRATAARRRAR
jgi:hypothetical protein